VLPVTGIVSFAVNFDETAMMSDILLPEHHFLERRYARFYGLFMTSHQNIDDSIRGLTVALGRNAVEPLFNTRLMDDIIIEIADRAGFLRGPGGINDLVNQGSQLEGEDKLDIDKKYTIEEILDRKIRQVFGKQYGFDSLLEHGVIYKYDGTGKRGYNYYYYPDNKTRFAIYFNRLKESGDRLRENLNKYNIGFPAVEDQEDYFNYYQAIPYWVPNHEGTVPPEYDMWACNWKTKSELRQDDPYELYIWLNTETARRKGLKDEEEVCVESQYGKTRGKLKLTELIHPEVVGIPACYGSSTMLMCPYAKEGPHFNILLSGNQNTGIDPAHGGINIS